MNPSPDQNKPNPSRLKVEWKDSAWFPPVLARSRFPHPRGQRIFWPLQIITDPTVNLGRTVTLENKL